MLDATTLIAPSAGFAGLAGNGAPMPASDILSAPLPATPGGFSGLLAQSAAAASRLPAEASAAAAPSAAADDALLALAAALDDTGDGDDAADTLGRLADVGTRIGRLLPRAAADAAMPALHAILDARAQAAARRADPLLALAAALGAEPPAEALAALAGEATAAAESAAAADDDAGDDEAFVAATDAPLLAATPAALPLQALSPAPAAAGRGRDAGVLDDPGPEPGIERVAIDGGPVAEPDRPALRAAPRNDARAAAAAKDLAGAPETISSPLPQTPADSASVTAAGGEPRRSEPAQATDGAAGAPPLPAWRVAGHGTMSAAPAAANEAPTFQAQLSAAIDSPAFGSALSLQISTLVAGDISQARLHLHPAELGPIAVQIGLDGQLAQVHMAAEHPATRQALEQAMPELARALQDAGFTMTGGGVFQQPRERQPAGDGAASAPARLGADGDALAAAPGLAAAPVHRARGLLDVFA